MKFNKQKEWLIDLDHDIARAMLENKKTRFDDVWDNLKPEFKDNAIKWYVKAKVEDINDII